ncbi:MAG: CHAT domain-containing tetratricopeptide repeat protein [Bacteroidota bacterium]|nr:CHAT domain-containing tetratricopeptide repeat protein [Bacteroidota bacterium]
MKKIVIFLLFISIFFVSCDILTKLLKDVVNESSEIIPDISPEIDDLVDDLVDDSGKLIDEEIDKMILLSKEKILNSYNVTDFQYAISYGDNSSLYENKDNFKKLSSFAYYLIETDAPPVVNARNFNSAGEVLFATNHFESAEQSFIAAYELYQELNMLNSTEAILTMSNLGLLYQKIGKYGLAETFTKDALNARTKNSNDTTGYSAALNNLGVLYKIQGKYSESEKYLNESTNFIKDKIGVNNMQYAIVQNNLAMLYQVMNKLEKAEKTLANALDIAKIKSKEKSPTYSRLRINMALLYQLQARYNEAEAIYKSVIESSGQRLGKNHPDYATMLRNLAALYMKMGRYSEVEQILTDAKDIYIKKFGTENPNYAKTVFEQAVYYQAVENYDTARSLLNEALTIQQKTLEKHHPDIANTYEHLAINYWAEDIPKEALVYYKNALDEYIFQINTYFESMSEGEKTKFWTEIQTKFILFYNFAAQYHSKIPELASITYNYHIQTKALLLSSSRKVKDRILNSNNPDLISKYNEWQDLKNYTAKLYALSNDELNARKINIDSIIEVTENLEKEITLLSNDFEIANNKKDINIFSIKNSLLNEDISIEIIRIDKYEKYLKTDSVFYIALLLTKMEEHSEMIIFNNGGLMETDHIKQYHKAIMSGKNMGKFYDYYWRKIDEKIPHNVTNIFLSIDGIYNQINVNSILLPDNNYVIDKFHVYNLTNTKDIISLKDNLTSNKNIQGKQATLFGFPDYLMDLPKDIGIIPPLPGTKQEIENITDLLLAKNWKIKSFIGRDANEANIKKTDNPFILHIATHGYFLEKSDGDVQNARSFGVEPARALNNPLLRSGLLLAGADETVLELNDKDNTEIDDGILNAYEASVLKLDETKLVILSACQTGLGDIKTGEGVYGLQRSFQIAGTQSIITSLWKVSDEGTRDLMTQFYKNWLVSGDEFDSFRKAQLYIKDKYKYPYYWGAFILVGK